MHMGTPQPWSHQNWLNSEKSVISLLQDAERRELSPQVLLRILPTTEVLFPTHTRDTQQVQSSLWTSIMRASCFMPTSNIGPPSDLELNQYLSQVSEAACIRKGLVKAAKTHFQIPVLLALRQHFFLLNHSSLEKSRISTWTSLYHHQHHNQPQACKVRGFLFLPVTTRVTASHS